MIIDSHAHIGRILVYNLSYKRVLLSMEKYGVDFSLVSCFESIENDDKGKPVPWIAQKRQNRVLKRTVKAVKKAPDKLRAHLAENPSGASQQADYPPDREVPQIYLRNKAASLPLKNRSRRAEAAADNRPCAPLQPARRVAHRQLRGGGFGTSLQPRKGKSRRKFRGGAYGHRHRQRRAHRAYEGNS